MVSIQGLVIFICIAPLKAFANTKNNSITYHRCPPSPKNVNLWVLYRCTCTVHVCTLRTNVPYNTHKRIHKLNTCNTRGNTAYQWISINAFFVLEIYFMNILSTISAHCYVSILQIKKKMMDRCFGVDIASFPPCLHLIPRSIKSTVTFYLQQQNYMQVLKISIGTRQSRGFEIYRYVRPAPPTPTPTPSSLHHHHSTAPRGAQPTLPNQMFLAWCLVSLKLTFFPSRLCSWRFFFFLRISDVRSFPFFLSLVEIMTLPPAFQNKFKEIAAKYPTTRVPSKVMDELCKWCRVNDREMSQQSISNQISKARGVTVHNYLENAAGSVSSQTYEEMRLRNEISNPINNPINQTFFNLTIFI